MMQVGKAEAGRFCWVDLAATDAARARNFYGQLFGWIPCEQPANGGSFTRLQLSAQDVGSLYQLGRPHLDRGLHSHWTPYIRVDDADDSARRVASLGGEVMVRPFLVDGVARIALVQDPVGACFGLWEPVEAETERQADG